MIVHEDDIIPVHFISPDWKNGPWIAGGSVLSWYKGEPVGSGDIDVYFKTEDDFKKFYKLIEPKSEEGYGGIFNIKKQNPDVDIVFSSDNAITFVYKDKWKIQLIKQGFYNRPQDVIDNFDISVCQLVTDGKDFAAGKDTLVDIKTNTLRIVKYRPGSVSRFVKYQAYGYKPLPNTLDNILAMPNLDETFVKTVEDDYDY